ncbi:adenosylcobinamide-phosphate synthase CbiB [Bacillus thermotolerans]|uniref:Cobalamin biosynthesis protein CobD n=1 Tax=Bacillus thermotolerans TaxID=1221996 RepID=A0A0F5I3R1_BACTR|nr:adenosylcobinamide-phosphate synthase CbiB [Bacillus thermotolerans]KKB36029.1 Adenosylcobinamide-phosphate synthase [Bacillus thermotolerans]KKB40156.1 Adenosylcobinamide-phosphate synthase [Bacillus thermotolerans]
MIAHLLAATAALFIDRLIGDPPHWPHPVRWLGSLIAFLEKHLNKGAYRRGKGLVMLLVVLLVTGSVTLLVVYFSYRLHLAAGVAVEALLIASAIACRSLKEAGMSVYEPLKQGDLPNARKRLSYIVGRDTDQLNEGEITRGAIETVAENTSDGVTAPLFWALIGGAPGAMVYRAINTCDSMVGYRNERYEAFGWFSARLDDLANWFPARLTGFLMIWSFPGAQRSKKKTWQLIRRDARNHPSPNSGWCEAAVAFLLGIQLGGVNTYKGKRSYRAEMGEPLKEKTADDILLANRIMERTTLLFLGVLWIGGGVYALARSWIESGSFI